MTGRDRDNSDLLCKDGGQWPSNDGGRALYCGSEYGKAIWGWDRAGKGSVFGRFVSWLRQVWSEISGSPSGNPASCRPCHLWGKHPVSEIWKEIELGCSGGSERPSRWASGTGAIGGALEREYPKRALHWKRRGKIRRIGGQRRIRKGPGRPSWRITRSGNCQGYRWRLGMCEIKSNRCWTPECCFPAW